MKKLISLALALVLSLSLIACGAKQDDTPQTGADTPDTTQTAKKQKLIVGFDAEFPPFGFIAADGSYDGFDLAMAEELCSRLGWDFEAVPIVWDSKDAELAAGTINCIWNGFTMEGREDKFTFSEPYMYNEQVVVVKKDSDAKKLEDLAGKTVLTQVDSAALHVLEDEKGQKPLADTFKELQTIGDYNNAFMQLESGMVDAVACDLSIASYQMAAKPDAYVKLGVLAPENYAVGFKKGDTELAQQVTDALKALNEDGTVKQLCDKYADQGITYDNWVL